MAINQQLTPADLLYRRLDILGKAVNLDMTSGSQGKSFTIFNAGNIGYPSPSKRVYVAAIIVEFSVPIGTGPTGSVWSWGGNGSADWFGTSQGITPTDCGLIAPFIWFPQLVNGPTAYNPPVYQSGVSFTANSHSIMLTSPATVTFTAVGWAS